MPLNLFHTMVQKSQKWPKTQIKGGSCLKHVKAYTRHPCFSSVTLLCWTITPTKSESVEQSLPRNQKKEAQVGFSLERSTALWSNRPLNMQLPIREGQIFEILSPLQSVFVLRKKGSKTKERMKEEEIEKGDRGPPTRKVFFWFCRTWTKRYLITSQTRVKRVSRIHHRTILRLVRWCIRLTRLTLVCEVIRYRLVQVRQNQKKIYNLSSSCEPVHATLPLNLSRHDRVQAIRFTRGKTQLYGQDDRPDPPVDSRLRPGAISFSPLACLRRSAVAWNQSSAQTVAILSAGRSRVASTLSCVHCTANSMICVHANNYVPSRRH